MANSVIGHDLAVDLGSAYTRAHQRGAGLVLTERSVLARRVGTGQVEAAGDEAGRLVGRTADHLETVHPVEAGEVVDVAAAGQLLRHVVAEVHRRRYFAKPRLVLAVSADATPVARRAVEQAGYDAGARRVWLVDRPLAAALGAGLPVHEPTGNLLADVGAGCTEVSVVGQGGIPVHRRVAVGGDAMDAALQEWLEREHRLQIGRETAERLKLTLGSAYPLVVELEADVRGRDLATGQPRTMTVFSTEVRRALTGPVTAIVAAITATLDATPVALVDDVMDRGVVLAGGAAELRGLDQVIRQDTGMPVHVATDPGAAVVRGLGTCVEDVRVLERVARTEPDRTHPQRGQAERPDQERSA